MTVCASGEGQTPFPGQPWKGVLCGGQGDGGGFLLCALLESISLGRGCPGATQVWAVAQLCSHTPVPTAVPGADQGPQAGVTLGPAAVLGVTPGLGLMAVRGHDWHPCPLSQAAHLSGRAPSSAQPQGI